jgi:isopenicillin-N epimerase
MKNLFQLNPEITYLAFGSFGACPKTIFEDYLNWQRKLEWEPVQFVAMDANENLKVAREALAAYINCQADDLVYVSNPSYGMNIIAKSLKLNAGDEILSTNLEYGAMDRTWSYYCGAKGAKYVMQEITLPIISKETFLEQFWKGYSPKTKAIFISQITSSTGLILPVHEICERAKELGLMTIVDGAHVPGHIPLDLQTLKADIYTGACHKWMMTPKGSSFLYVTKELQHLFDPLMISWGFESAAPSHSQFLDYHQLQGTRDISPFLTIPKAIEFMKEHDWVKVGESCRDLVKNNAQTLCSILGTEPLSPITDEFLGQMLSVRIQTDEPEKLQKLLYTEHKIEIPIMRHRDMKLIRYSIQAFNTQADLDRLFNVLETIL